MERSFVLTRQKINRCTSQTLFKGGVLPKIVDRRPKESLSGGPIGDRSYFDNHKLRGKGYRRHHERSRETGLEEVWWRILQSRKLLPKPRDKIKRGVIPFYVRHWSRSLLLPFGSVGKNPLELLSTSRWGPKESNGDTLWGRNTRDHKNCGSGSISEIGYLPSTYLLFSGWKVGSCVP